MKKKILAILLSLSIALFALNCNKKQMRKVHKGLKKAQNKLTSYMKRKKTKRKKRKKKKKKHIKAVKRGKLIYVNDMKSALKLAKKKKRKILVIVSWVGCEPCMKMKKEVYPDAKVKKEMKKYIIVTEYSVSGIKSFGDDVDLGKYYKKVAEKNGDMYTPTFAIFTSKGKLLKKFSGGVEKEWFLKWLKDKNFQM